VFLFAVPETIAATNNHVKNFPCNVPANNYAFSLTCAAPVVTDSVGPDKTLLADSVFDPAILARYVSFLSSDSMKGRLTGTPESMKAAEFIGKTFEEAGLQSLPDLGSYYMAFRLSNNAYTVLPRNSLGYNVVAILPGLSKPKEIVIFCAHFDHVGVKSKLFFPSPAGRSVEKGDTIYNGANDNASGVAGLLALANYFGALKYNERTIMFVAFSGEEFGLLGSKAFQRIIRPSRVKAVLNLEMIGRTIYDQAKPFVTGSSYSDVRRILNEQLQKTDPIKYGSSYFESDENMTIQYFNRSDNFPFALNGVPAHTIMLGTQEDPHYHSVQDETATLNFRMMSDILKSL
ncbi:MAG TPA: M28 family peptidase, partial [Cyclobacteriaceae bacterium]|nr:M28 family peptidase [Cyclobacteriaceae bacterium]